MLVDELDVGTEAVVERGFIIINVLVLWLSLQLRVVDPVGDVFSNIFGKKTILFAVTDVDNVPNRDGILTLVD